MIVLTGVDWWLDCTYPWFVVILSCDGGEFISI